MEQTISSIIILELKVNLLRSFSLVILFFFALNSFARTSILKDIFKDEADQISIKLPELRNLKKCVVGATTAKSSQLCNLQYQKTVIEKQIEQLKTSDASSSQKPLHPDIPFTPLPILDMKSTRDMSIKQLDGHISDLEAQEKRLRQAVVCLDKAKTTQDELVCQAEMQKQEADDRLKKLKTKSE